MTDSRRSNPPDVLELPPAGEGLFSICRSLRFRPEEEAIVREVGRRLQRRIPDWVDSFYVHLLRDPVATGILRDDARVIRLKRSLVAWFHGLFTLRYDAAYERARESIGVAHVALRMPVSLMVTSMGALRRIVEPDVEAAFPDDPARAREAREAVSMALDLELALMLESFRRRDRALLRRRDRAIYAERAARRLSVGLANRIETALCYLDLAAYGGDARALALARDALTEVVRFSDEGGPRAQAASGVRTRVSMAEICRLARAEVSVGAHTPVDVQVVPEDLAANVQADSVRMALEELLQNAVLHGAGGSVVLRCHAEGAEVVCAVEDEGPGWPTGVRHIEDLYDLGTGLGLSFCERVADLHDGRIELFRAPQGGAGVRIRLPGCARTDSSA
jgi:signal transduction histidine kinase